MNLIKSLKFTIIYFKSFDSSCKTLIFNLIALPTLRTSLRIQIEEYVDQKGILENQNPHDLLAKNKMAKQK